MAIGQKSRIVSLPVFFLTMVASCVFHDLSVSSVQWFINLKRKQLAMVSQMSVSSSLNISITTWSSAHDARFRKPKAISQTRSPSSKGWFAVEHLSTVKALPCVSLLCTEVSLVSVSSSVLLCAVRWRESSVSQGLSPVYVPDTVRSSCHPVDRGNFFVVTAHFAAE